MNVVAAAFTSDNMKWQIFIEGAGEATTVTAEKNAS